MTDASTRRVERSEPDSNGKSNESQLSPAADAALFADYLAAELPLHYLARRHGMSIDAILDWAESPATQRRIERLNKVARQRSETVNALARPTAIHALESLILSETDPETTRKAAVALLFARRATAPNAPRPPTPPTLLATPPNNQPSPAPQSGASPESTTALHVAGPAEPSTRSSASRAAPSPDAAAGEAQERAPPLPPPPQPRTARRLRTPLRARHAAKLIKRWRSRASPAAAPLYPDAPSPPPAASQPSSPR